MTDPTLYVAAGALVGVLVGLTGVGGGSLMTPILVLAFGQSPAVAVGTDLLFAALTKITASFSFGASRRIDWRIVRRLALGSLPGAAGVLATLSLSTRSALHADRFLLLCLGVMLVLTSAGMLLERIVRLRLAKSAQPRPLANPTTTPPLALTVLVGFLIGVAVTLTSVGAGALGTVALLWLYPRLPTDRLVGTDIAHAVPLTLLAGLGHASLGHINTGMLGYLLIGSVPSVLLASRLAIRISQPRLRLILALMLAVVGTKILLGK